MSERLALPPPRRVRALSDGWVVAAAIGCWVGALWARPVPLAVAIVVGCVGVLARLAPAVVVGALLVASSQMAGVVVELSQVSGGRLEGRATVVADAEWWGSAVRLDVEIDGHRWQAWARGTVAYRVDAALAGERWRIAGRSRVAGPADRRWLWPRHAVGTVELDQAAPTGDGDVAHRWANRTRRVIEQSVRSLSPRDRALVTGFVYGDDRGQLPEVVDDFRATGLTHLLAVSGSNVAVVLAGFGPLLRRLSHWPRLVAVMLLLFEFALVTRAEPSVLRACVLAVLATGSVTIGRPASSLRLLALATGLLVLVDPMLVHSVGFQLSVAASLGIVVFARPVAGHLVGPRWVREPMAVTLAAQVGVLPVQVAVFGSLPLVSVPANLLAGPAAGPAMVWGLNAGLVGGVAGEPVASVLHLPTRLLVGWVAWVARTGAAADLPAVDGSEVVTVLVLVLAAVVAVARRPGVRAVVLPLAAVAVFVAAGARQAELPAEDDLWVLSSEPSVVVMDRPGASWALGALRGAGVDHIDVLVSRSTSRSSEQAVAVLGARVGIEEVWAAGSMRLPDGVALTIVEIPTVLAGAVVSPDGERLRVDRAG